MKRKRYNNEVNNYDNDAEHVSPNIKKFKIKYLNPKQAEYGHYIKTKTIIIAVGSSGSGKTHIATLHAMESFLNQEVDRIVICRPAVCAGGEEIGFLPGGINDKMWPFIRPVMDTLNMQWSTRQIMTMLEYNKLEICPLAYLRGRNLKNTFIIADEMENCTSELMYMLLTRLGEGSKMVITGDEYQSDIKSRALSDTIDRIGNLDDIAYVKFNNNEVVRHPLVENIISVWEDDKDIPLPKFLNT